jgi:hypothetical protein
MKKMDKLAQAIWDCLVELYANSTPSADFNKLVEEAPINEDGRKEIKFMDYEIDYNKMEEIIDKHRSKLLKYSRNKYFYERQFNFNIYLGCSPKSVRKTIA